MEYTKSFINDAWKLFSAGTLIAFLLLLFLDNSRSFSSSMLSISSLKMFDSSTKRINPSNLSIFTVNQEKPSNFTTLNPVFDGTNFTLNPVQASTVRLNRIESSNITVTNLLKPSNFTENPMDVANFAVKKLTNEQRNGTKNKCNMSEGKWVYKAEKIPSYDSTSCPFLEEKMSCQKNGRPDFEYEKWLWEATDCDIPLFNGTHMLEKLRNKRMIIVGDSLNRNMWESLACLLYTSIPSSRVHVNAKDIIYKFLKAKDYNFTFEFHWSPFLVSFDTKRRNRKKVLVLDKVSANSKLWRGADIMIFNSGHWWSHTGKLKSWDLFQYKGVQTEDMSIELAYDRAMKTWAKWIQNNVNPEHTTVYFRSISAEHKMRQFNQWCYNVTSPLTDESYVSVYPKTLVDIIESLIKKMKKHKVNYLNVTKLSEYRIDAHPSVYRSINWKNLTKKFENILSYADCSHWCLPGLPDTWNRLLYASLFFNASNMTS